MTSATRIPDELFPPPVAETGSMSPPAIAEAADDATLMPYEKVAKAIFVKANGLPAYKRATRFVRHAD